MWAVIPFGQGLAISDYSIGIFYTLALSSLGVYGVLLAGWSANSKYAFLGSLRSTAAMISHLATPTRTLSRSATSLSRATSLAWPSPSPRTW